MAPLTPLVGADWLAGHLTDPEMRVVDCRWSLADPAAGRAAYDSAHIPGAAYFSLDADLTGASGPGRHPLPDPGAFAARLGTRGIADRATVVAYDDQGGAFAARLWWMVRSLGHDAVTVLDGGITSWCREGRATTRDEPSWPRTVFHGANEWTGTIDRDQVSARLGSISLLDARDPERYRGDIEPIDPIAGHIPGAVSMPHRGNLTPSGHFLPKTALAARFAAAADPIVSYCGSGVTACHSLLALEVIGRSGLLYPGSWSDWCTAGGRVETAGTTTSK